eukprot:657896_1
MNVLCSSRSNKWNNQMIKKKFKNRSCRSKPKKAIGGYVKKVPDHKVRGWIRGKASPDDNKHRVMNQDLRKIKGSVYHYDLDVYGDGMDDYDEEWLDNWNDAWIQQQKQIQREKFLHKKHNHYAIAESVASSIYSVSEAAATPSPSPPPKPAPVPIVAPLPVPIAAPLPVPAPPPIAPIIPINDGLVADVEYTKTKAEEKEYLTTGEAYVTAMSDIETFGIYSSIEGLAERSTYASHKDDKADPTSTNFKKIMKEIRKTLPVNIYTSINGSMFVRFDENNPRFIQALLTGIDDTPYGNGLFLFDIYLGDDYPNKPLQIKHVTRNATACHGNNGPGGFSPNLHQGSGKVCLSLLGTWSGPGWTPGESNVYQVISTVMFMIFGANHPYYMEPGCGGWEGTVATRTRHERRVMDYDEEVMYHNAKSAILETLKTPYVGFEDVIRTHFKIKAPFIIKTIETWMNHKGYTDNFKTKMKPVLEEIKTEFAKL